MSHNAVNSDDKAFFDDLDGRRMDRCYVRLTAEAVSGYCGACKPYHMTHAGTDSDTCSSQYFRIPQHQG
jgi:hypothetical protein